MSDRDLAARRLLAVTEEELRRVVLDMHDGPVQCLFAALAQLAELDAKLAAVPEARANCAPPLARAVSLLEESLRDIRQIVSGLYAPEFPSRALADILEGVVVQHEALTDSAVTLRIEQPLPAVVPLAKIALYRVLQEALSNVRRHAGGGAAEVTVWAEHGCVLVEIADRGRGFEPPLLVGPDATEQEQHVGLRGMRERAAMAGGYIHVESSVGVGTRVRVCVPPDGGAGSGGAELA